MSKEKDLEMNGFSPEQKLQHSFYSGMGVALGLSLGLMFGLLQLAITLLRGSGWA